MKINKLISELEKALLDIERDHERPYPSTVKINEDKLSEVIKLLKRLQHLEGDKE
jgi:hypothetical protein